MLCQYRICLNVQICSKFYQIIPFCSSGREVDVGLGQSQEPLRDQAEEYVCRRHEEDGVKLGQVGSSD